MLLERVRTFIAANGLLTHDGGPVLVAVSGGADSVCLLLVLSELGYDVEAVHCNFHLRGDESDRDEQFVIRLCADRHIPLHLTHFDTQTYAAVHKVSIEMAARELRYGYFEQLRRDLSAQAVCVAHHQDDSVETMLLNLLRGTGLHGLTGIKPQRSHHVVRPLLCVSRQAIEQWLAERRQPYVTDSTNLVADIARNRLRLNVIPLLSQVFPQSASNILATMRRLAQAELVYADAVDKTLHALVDADGALPISDLLACPSPESILFEWLSPKGFSPAAIEQISNRLPQAQGGRQWQSESHELTVHEGKLLLTPRQQDGRPTLLIPEPGLYAYDAREHFRLEIADGQSICRAPYAASLDADTVDFPLTVRGVRQGDRFQPFGMTGTRLVSDFLTDRHVPLPEKRRQLVVTDRSGHIVWLVGHRPDGRYCVGAATRHTLTISHQTDR